MLSYVGSMLNNYMDDLDFTWKDQLKPVISIVNIKKLLYVCASKDT